MKSFVPFVVDVFPAACTVFAAVTIAALDSILHSGFHESLAENFLPNFSTQQKNLCYYAALILLQKFFLLLAAAHGYSGAFRSKIGGSSYVVKWQFEQALSNQPPERLGEYFIYVSP
jgi:E3 ubiquitin-protein ligase DOA10